MERMFRIMILEYKSVEGLLRLRITMSKISNEVAYERQEVKVMLNVN